MPETPSDQTQPPPSFWYIAGDSLNQMYDLMRPVHEASAHLSEAEINAAIDDALADVRCEGGCSVKDRDLRGLPEAEGGDR
jgi:hypothetical protein